jgi:Fe-Mn family superoxide dismutase
MPTTRLSSLLPRLFFVAICAAAHVASAETAAPTFTLPDLPYPSSALEPAIDTQTMEIHHGRHHRAYVDNLNAKVAEFPALADASIEDIQRRISSFDAAVRNNGGGHYNHSLFWELMAPVGKGGAPSAELATAIDAAFGSFEAFKKAFSEAGAKQFGSGWAWLLVKDDGTLAVSSTPNQDNPLMDVVAVRGMPLLAVDVWEHAYYLKYQNKRADYLSAWWSVVDWNAVNARFAAASKKQG